VVGEGPARGPSYRRTNNDSMNDYYPDLKRMQLAMQQYALCFCRCQMGCGCLSLLRNRSVWELYVFNGRRKNVSVRGGGRGLDLRAGAFGFGVPPFGLIGRDVGTV
jgi:hypothetical protein